jgi:alkylation response protein AidB-like acyl-CoA dehydrogenase
MNDLQLTDEQRELAAVAAALLDARAPLSLARSYLEGAGQMDVLGQAIKESGWFAVGLDEDDPFGVVGLCLLAEACGEHAAPSLLVDTAVAARLAAALDPSDELVSAVAAGEVATALTLLESGSDWTLSEPRAAARPDSGGGGWLLSGTKLDVHHGSAAEALAVLVDLGADGTLGVAVVRPQDAGVGVTPQRAFDPSSAPCAVTFDDVLVPAERVSVASRQAIGAALTVGTVATAAEGLGASWAALTLAVEYAKERRQFGRPIGAFQALQHHLADLYVEREAARATIFAAAAAIDDGASSAGELASIAKARAARASRTVVEGAVHAFGGIAFTWEHDVHLLQRRVHECERRFGDALDHERVLGDLIAGRASTPA